MTAKPVPEHISDERLAALISGTTESVRLLNIRYERSAIPEDATEYAEQLHKKQLLLSLATELQHRREAGAGSGEPVEIGYTNWRGEYAVRRIIPIRPWFGSTEWHPEPQWLLKAIDAEKGAERDFAIADIGRAASPSSPASGVRVKVKPLEWHGPDFEDEYWAASLDLKYVIHPPNERGVRWLGGVGGYFRLVDEAKSVAEKHNEARILSALGEHP